MGNLCATGEEGCAGTSGEWGGGGGGVPLVGPRLRHRQADLFTARNGATLSGTFWAQRAGPRADRDRDHDGLRAGRGEALLSPQDARPNDGYVVMTSPAGSGAVGHLGECRCPRGGAFQTDGRLLDARDAIDFFLSAPRIHTCPFQSCESAPAHAPKQNRRVRRRPRRSLQTPSQTCSLEAPGPGGPSYGGLGVS